MKRKTIKKLLTILLATTMVVGACVSCSSDKSTAEKKQTETTEKSDEKVDKKNTDDTSKKEVKNDKSENGQKSDKKVENAKLESKNTSDKNDTDKNTSNKNEKPSTSTNKPDNSGSSSNKPSKPDNSGQSEKPQHKHSYSASVTKQPSCSSSGTKTYTCSCGNSYSESIPALPHNWQHHDATGHYDKVVDQPAWDEPIYETHAFCYGCGQDFGPGEAGVQAAGEHTMMVFGDGCDSYYSEEVQTGTIHHEATYKDVWVQDSAAYDSCTSCGARK